MNFQKVYCKNITRFQETCLKLPPGIPKSDFLPPNLKLPKIQSFFIDKIKRKNFSEMKNET